MLSSTFAIFGARFMNDLDNKKDSFPCLALPNSSVRKGVRDVVVAQGGGAAVVALLYSIHQANLPAGAGPVRRIRVDVGPTHRHPHVVDGPHAVARSLQRLSPRLLSRPLVAVAAGQGAG